MLWRERLLPSHILTLVAILVEQLPEGCTEKDEKEFPVQRRPADERIRIGASLPNSVGTKAGFGEVSCVFLYLVL